MEYSIGLVLTALFIVITALPTAFVVGFERDEKHHYASAAAAAIFGIAPSVVFYGSTPYSATSVSLYGKMLLWVAMSMLLWATSFVACILSERRDAEKGAFAAPIKELQRQEGGAYFRDVFVRKAIAREDYTEALRLKEGGAWSAEDWKALRT